MAHSRRAASNGRNLLLLAGIVATLYFARAILIPLALALTISFVLTPLVTVLQKLRLGRVPSTLLVVLVSLAAAGGMGWILGTQLLEVANDLPRYQFNIRQKIAAFHAPTNGAIGKATETVKQIGKELAATPVPAAVPQSPETPRVAKRSSSAMPNAAPGTPTPVQVVEPSQNELQYLRDLLKPAFKPLEMAGIVLVFTVFILIKREDLRNRILRLAGMGQLNTMTQALDDGAQRISRYLMLQFLVNAVYGLLFGFGLFLIGVPNAVLWGAIAAVLRIVPYVGTLAAAVLPILLALAAFNSWTPPVFVFLLYAILEGVIGNFVEPWLYGAHLGVSSLALLVTTVVWTVLWGWAGLVLSTPLTVCVIVLGRYVPQLSFLHVLLGDEAPLSPDAQFYQRLLAMDPLEARAIADDFLKDRPLVELYDNVLVPALGLAEQDRHKGALDEAREVFLFLSTSELVSELAAHKPASPSNPTLVPSVEFRGRPAGVDSVESPPVICIPASDQADELTAVMLAQLLEQGGINALAFSVDSAWTEPVKSLSLGNESIVCISALPPFAFSHARSACQRIRSLSPGARIIVGLWCFTGDIDKTKERFGNASPDYVLTTLAGAVSQIVAWLAPDRNVPPASPLEADVSDSFGQVLTP